MVAVCSKLAVFFVPLIFNCMAQQPFITEVTKEFIFKYYGNASTSNSFQWPVYKPGYFFRLGPPVAWLIVPMYCLILIFSTGTPDNSFKAGPIKMFIAMTHFYAAASQSTS